MKDGTFTADRLLAMYDRVAEAEDAIPRLRRFVLDLAVRGKLVEQDPTDEPAADLLKRIAKEKARLVKAGEIKDAKPIALNGEPVTQAPMGWMVVPLGEVINRHLGGGTPSKNDHSYWGGEIRWASVKDVGKAKYVDDTIDRITQKGLENSSSNLVPAGNLIVVTRMGLGQLSINRVPVAINQDLRALFLSPFVDIDFVYNFFLTYGMEGTGLTVKGIKIEELLGIPFPLPPLVEQQRIVAKVDELMALCDRLQVARAGREAVRDRLTAATLTRLTAPETDAETFPAHARVALQTLPTLTTRPDQIKTLRQTILNLAVRGKLVAQDPTDEPAAELLKRIGGEIAAYSKSERITQTLPASVEAPEQEFGLPKGWSWTRLCGLFNVITDGDHQPPPKADDGIAFLTIGNVTTGKLDFAGCRTVPAAYFDALPRYRTPRKGDILYTVVGATYGRPALVETDRSFCVQRHIAIMKPSRLMNLRFLLHLLASPMVYYQATRGTTGTAQPTIALRPLRNFVIAVPPLPEQHRIVAKVDALMTLCDQMEASLTTATTTRSRLLEALLHEALGPAGQVMAAAE